jgi:hypothetical protein
MREPAKEFQSLIKREPEREEKYLCEVAANVNKERLPACLVEIGLNFHIAIAPAPDSLFIAARKGGFKRISRNRNALGDQVAAAAACR